ncbi:NADPH-dependent 7-cyano-7-deazaguanine reductase QueF [Cellvibrio sp. NN19]|uniref:NADPH-dependent 7-cyano-7-deazaguanine reductase QueF n=1 Tax=Cellvibrio chitinivorans TaxID=3102792 RepID=UPI002B416165|nr:NADPH-dependent 7-cyano-7-deazaguanine reductase QueF [Cellvibrio sp. NN19]
MSHNPLGQQTEYVSVYSPQLLFPISRAESRRSLGLGSELPFYGVDIWTGYELSWLDLKGKPVVAVAEFFIPCTSEFIVESKSFKLYLNSFNQTRLAGVDEVEFVIARDLSHVTHADVRVSIRLLSSSASAIAHLTDIAEVQGELLDELDVEIDTYHPAPELLTTEDSEVEECLVSHLLKTNCPVTGQPDWASVVIRYQGKKIQRESLLRYIISFREHQDFHEHCVERMFSDISRVCAPQSLSVYARYTRRGGLDINPFRSSSQDMQPELLRLIRQ